VAFTTVLGQSQSTVWVMQQQGLPAHHLVLHVHSMLRPPTHSAMVQPVYLPSYTSVRWYGNLMCCPGTFACQANTSVVMSHYWHLSDHWQCQVQMHHSLWVTNVM